MLQAADLLLDDPKALLRALVALRLDLLEVLEHELQVQADRREGVADLVREPRQQASELGQAAHPEVGQAAAARVVPGVSRIFRVVFDFVQGPCRARAGDRGRGGRRQ
ncbi:MAG: hypothetical protein Fur0037_13020 [Planctomycetota bacterium]